MKLFLTALIVLTTFNFSVGQDIDNSIQLSGKADFLKENDSVTLIVNKYGLLNEERSFRATLTAVAHDHKFNFSWHPTTFPQYVTLQFNKHRNSSSIFYYHAQSGDQIKLIYENGKLHISEKLDSSFKVQNGLCEIENHYNRKYRLPEFNASNLQRRFFVYDSIANEKILYLKSFHEKLTPQMFGFLIADIYSKSNSSKYYDLYWVNAKNLNEVDSIKRAFLDYQIKHPEPSISATNLKYYPYSYMEYILKRYYADSCLFQNKNFDLISCLDYLMENYRGVLLEQLVTSAICENAVYPNGLANEIKKALTFVKTTSYVNFLERTLKDRVEGARAFDFALLNLKGKTIRLSNYDHQLILLDFWFTGCGNCRVLTPFLEKLEKNFHGKPVKFLSINIDKEKSQWIKSTQTRIYTTQYGINLFADGNVQRESIINHYQVHGCPTLILITKNGNIVNIKTDPRLDNGVELTKQINYYFDN